MSAPVYAGLLHHSMLDKQGKQVVTSITNLDIHDISRSARTFGLAGYYLINPEPEQQRVARRIMEHWNSGGGREYNPDRSEAFRGTQIVSWLDDAVAEIEKAHGERPFVVMTSARVVEGVKILGYSELRARIDATNAPILLVFGTGWGIEQSLLIRADAVLKPLRPQRESHYLHLSVRAAAVTVFDRLLGARED